MVVADVGKLAILLLISTGIVIGLVTGTWEGEAATPAWATLTAIIGYLVGNGAAAVRTKAPQPTLTASPDHVEKANGPGAG